MGTSKSKPSAKGQVLVQTDKNMYLINDTIRGVVSLNVTQEGFEGDCIFIKFVGLEDSKLVCREGTGKNRRTVTHTQKNKFITSSVLLQSFNGQLPIIQCQYPFEIPLSFLTSTTINVKPPPPMNFHCYVKFYLCAFVNMSTPKKLNEVIKYKVPIIITRPFIPLERPFMQNQAKVLSTCCCCSKGVCNVELRLPVTDFMVGQQAQLTLRVDNTHSKHNINGIIISFKGQFEITFRNGRKRVVPMEYQSKGLGALQPGEDKTYNESISISKAETIQYELNSSTTTTNIVHKHMITAMLIYDGCICDGNYFFVHVPITVVQPPQQAYDNVKQNPECYQEPNQPPQLAVWNPQVLKHTTTLNPQVISPYENLFTPNNEILQSPAQQEQYNIYHAQNQHYQPISQNVMQNPFSQ